MSDEARELFNSLPFDLPDRYLNPLHKSGMIFGFNYCQTLFKGGDETLEEKVKTHYSKIKREHLVKLKKFYQLDLDFFDYEFDIDTLDIRY